MPRKFKIAIAIPPNNDVDVFANDLGLIAIIENNELKGFNIAIGGGMSTTHGNPDHYARLASVIGFVDTKEKLLKAVYEILTIQRDYGNRSDRKLARLKYTVDRLGVDWWKEELEKRAVLKLKRQDLIHLTSVMIITDGNKTTKVCGIIQYLLKTEGCWMMKKFY